MCKRNLEELFKRIQEVTNVQDVALHLFKDGKLNPVQKTQTDQLGIERWKEVHGKNPVYIKNVGILTEIMEEPKTIVIDDTKNDNRSANEFFFFGIESILVIPVIKESIAKGIIVVASIGKLHNFTQEEISRCEELVREFFLEKGCEIDYENQ